MSLFRSVLPLAVSVAVALSPRWAAAQGAGAPAEAPSGLTATFSLGGGGEMGLEEGEDAGLGEVELTAGWELADRGIRPELALSFGFQPEDHVGVRGGVRLDLARLPLAVRLAVDAANARGDGLRWRWLLVGLVAEVRLTGLLGLYAEVDSGAPLNRDAGVPLIARAGASFRF
jgi:hypothetical protein